MDIKPPKKPNFTFDDDVKINIIEDEDVKIAAPEVEPPPASVADSFFVSDTANDTIQMDVAVLDFSEPEKPPLEFGMSSLEEAEKEPKPKSKKPKLQKPPEELDPQMAKIEAMRKKKAYNKKMKRRGEHLRTFSHIFISLILVIIIVVSAVFLSQFAVRAFLDFTGIVVDGEEFTVFVEIPADATTGEIAAILAQEDIGILEIPWLFAFYTRFTGKEGDYLHGLFEFRSNMSYSQIVSTLQNRPQSTETVTITIPEGLTVMEIAQLLHRHHVCRAEDFMEFYKEKLDLFDFERRINENPLRFNQMEGYLFPETYEFFVINGFTDDMDTTAYARRAARTIYSHMNIRLTPVMYKQIREKMIAIEPGFGLDEFMTLASMVQWESAKTEDMRNVASVFLNRLMFPTETNGRLESDVTEKYANENIRPFLTQNRVIILDKCDDCKLLLQDEDSQERENCRDCIECVPPHEHRCTITYSGGENAALINSMIEAYNTYSVTGLPPGPVCNPGMSAMLAVLDAPVSSSGYFYFCSNIETGEMFFARNLREHELNEVKAGLRDSSGNLIYR
jgi:UPF0755 protein